MSAPDPPRRLPRSPVLARRASDRRRRTRRATLTLNRPDVAQRDRLGHGRRPRRGDRRSRRPIPTVRVVFVTGAGRAFSAGGDLKSYQTLQRDPVRFPQFVKDLHRIFGRLRTLRVPAVALVNGVTVAGGLELMLNCDFALAARSARIGDGHLNFGQMGGGGVLTLLPRDRSDGPAPPSWC